MDIALVGVLETCPVGVFPADGDALKLLRFIGVMGAVEDSTRAHGVHLIGGQRRCCCRRCCRHRRRS